jgi:methyl-accepting chemotaxis protein
MYTNLIEEIRNSTKDIVGESMKTLAEKWNENNKDLKTAVQKLEDAQKPFKGISGKMLGLQTDEEYKTFEDTRANIANALFVYDK